MCLISVNFNYKMIGMYIPDQEKKIELPLAGLGEKKVSLLLYSDAQELHCQLVEHFPKLSESGGYELLRATDKGGEELIGIDMPSSGYTVEYLKAIVTLAKLYIRPLQKDLDLGECSKDESCKNVHQDCHNCGELLPMNLLKDHIANCPKANKYENWYWNSDFIDDCET